LEQEKQEAEMREEEKREGSDALRMAGLRPVQIWVPDTSLPGFAEECRRQCRLAAQAGRADSADTAVQRFMDEASERGGRLDRMRPKPLM
jgi:hypothetical protein